MSNVIERLQRELEYMEDGINQTEQTMAHHTQGIKMCLQMLEDQKKCYNEYVRAIDILKGKL